MSHISIIFKGRNGLGDCDLPYTKGSLKTNVVLVQRIFSSVSGAVISIQDASDSFGNEITGTNKLAQTTSNDWSDQLFLAVVDLP